MKRHILVVGRHNDVHRLLERPDLRLSLLTPLKGLGKIDNPQRYHRLLAFAESAPIAEWVAQAAMLHQHDPVETVICFNEPVEEHTAAIANALGLPYHAPEVIDRIHNKERMRQALRAAGVDPTENRVVTTAEEIAAFAESYGYPVILKPVDGRGSMGVSLVRRPEESATAMNWFQESIDGSSMLAEPYLEGEEYSVESFSEDGEHRILAITTKFKEAHHFVELGHSIPADLPAAVADTIGQFVCRALTAIGLRQGPGHTEVMLTSKGPHMIETHARLGGDFIAEMIELTTGLNLTDLWVRQTLGEKVLNQIAEPIQHLRHAAVWFATPQAVGRLEKIDGLDTARAMPGVAQVVKIQEPGTPLGAVRNSFTRGACVVAVGDSAAQALATARAATEQITFHVACQG